MNNRFFQLPLMAMRMGLLMAGLGDLSCNLHAQDVVSNHAMVASAHPSASRVGVEILQAGGNAVDAAVAMALTLGVVEPNASGLGGGGFFMYQGAEKGEAVMIDYREKAPLGIDAASYYRTTTSFDSLTHAGAHSIGVPGTVAGLHLAWKKLGSLPWEQVVAPARLLAEQGLQVNEVLAKLIFETYDLISADSATASVFVPDGFLPAEAGSVVQNSALAQTLQQLGQSGPEWLYQGAGADALTAFISAKGGILAKEDLAGYRAEVRRPLEGQYRDFTIITTAPPSSGASLIELMQILAGYDLRPLQHNSAAYIHLLAEAMKLILCHRAEVIADPAFYRVPVQKLIDPAFAADQRRFIRLDSASFHPDLSDLLPDESGSTTHLSVVDEQGNMVALTQSINTWFGSGLMDPQTGILLNNHLGDFDERPHKPNSVAGGKRPASYTTPTFVLKNGKPFLTIGTPGGDRIITALAQILVNIIDFGMSVDAAIEAPRIHPGKGILYLEKRIPQPVAAALAAMGHTVEYKAEYDAYFGGAQGICIDAVTGRLSGGADSRRAGVAIGY